MRATLIDKKEVAEGTIWFRYELEKIVDFKPGQFFYLSIKKLKFPDELGKTRHFSIVNSPTDNKFIEMTTRKTGSGFKETLKELPIGSEVEISSISGEFVLPEDVKKPLVFLAGGIGITPFMSMFRFIKEEVLPYKITLFYSNKDKNSTPFLEELQSLANENIYFKLISIMTEDSNWEGEAERINGEMLKKYLFDLNSYTYYVAGPPLFIQAILDVLKKINVDRKNIKIENFSGYKTMYGTNN